MTGIGKRLLSTAMAAAISLTVFAVSPVVVGAAEDYPWETWGDASVSKLTAALSTGTFVIENKDFVEASFAKRVGIERGGKYRVSVEVLAENFAPNPQNPQEWPKLMVGDIKSGGFTPRAVAGEAVPNNKWVPLSCAFEAKDNDNLYIQLCFSVGKGKATFRNLTLEQVIEDTTISGTAWNVLAVFYDRADVTINPTGKKEEHVRDNAVKGSIAFNKEVLTVLPEMFADVTGGRASISNIDVIDIASPITKLMSAGFVPSDPSVHDGSQPVNNGLMYDPDDVVKQIEAQLMRKQYDQVIVYFPVAYHDKVAQYYTPMWVNGRESARLINGVMTYYAFIALNDYTFENKQYTYKEQACWLLIHELLHVAEAREANQMGRPYRFDGTGRMNLHSVNDYGYPTNPEYKWDCDYAQNLLPDKKGLPADAFRTCYIKETKKSITLGAVAFTQDANVTNLDAPAQTPIPTPAPPNPNAPKVGAKIGDVLNTDIRAFIDGHGIPASNIGGSMYIMAADLRNYGFEVTYDNGARATAITLAKGKAFTPLEIAKASSKVGDKIGTVLYTDIKTYILGKEVTSVNVDGRTAIPFAELKAFGKVKYDNAARSSTVTVK